ncbi:MAG: carbonic anhydrase [Sulfurospirillum sp.]|nr:carbonic anhydrase [Sulfurospirillum sp.]MBL0702719.1 carbonic anhydrase [Sulfurospirillum sp.]
MKIQDLIDGYGSFKGKKFKKYENKFLDLVKNGQKAKVLFIACSDSRVDPALITNSNPGDLFVLRNIGNFVPPFSPDNDYHATAAGIEYAVHILKVTDIIVCGHSNCGAIDSLYKKIDNKNLLHVKKWLDLGLEAKQHVENSIDKNATKNKKLELTEKVSIVFQMKNLLSYPEIKDRVSSGKLSLRGWYYKIKTGELEYFCDLKREFLPMI